jgi:hypothetical protein
MLEPRKDITASAGKEGRCDIHVWSGACEHGYEDNGGDKYLCPICETIADLDHEVNHDSGSHVSGDYDNLY